ncbi:MAG: PilZ domain-containing protein [Spirochaetales bacterium]|nr:PilZ domain-containing protein [Spirochaetales bacterium]
MGIVLNRIEQEYIFRTLREEQTLMFFQTREYQFSGTIIGMNDIELKIDIKAGDFSLISENDNLEVFYSFQGSNLTFSSQIIDLDRNFVFIKQPDEVVKNSHRGYRRVPFHEKMSVYFYLSLQKFELNFPKAKTMDLNNKPRLSTNFDPANLKDLITSFREKIKRSVSEHNIVLMKNREPESTEEKLMLRTSRLIWIPGTDKSLPETNPFQQTRLLTRQNYIEAEIKAGTQSYKIESKLKNHIFEKKLNKIHSELYVPFFFREYMVGYIYLANTGDYKQGISKELVEYTDQFSKVLCYSLKENGYFDTSKEEKEEQFIAPIIDLSASGLLFAHYSQDLDNKLSIFREMDIYITIKDKKLVLNSWIIRKFNDAKRFYYGTQFRAISEKDFCYLYEYLYKEPFKPQGKYVW